MLSLTNSKKMQLKMQLGCKGLSLKCLFLIKIRKSFHGNIYTTRLKEFHEFSIPPRFTCKQTKLLSREFSFSGRFHLLPF